MTMHSVCLSVCQCLSSTSPLSLHSITKGRHCTGLCSSVLAAAVVCCYGRGHNRLGPRDDTLVSIIGCRYWIMIMICVCRSWGCVQSCSVAVGQRTNQLRYGRRPASFPLCSSPDLADDTAYYLRFRRLWSS